MTINALIDLFACVPFALVQRGEQTIASARFLRFWAPDIINSEGFALRRTANQLTWVAETNEQIAGFADLEPGWPRRYALCSCSVPGPAMLHALCLHIHENAAMRRES